MIVIGNADQQLTLSNKSVTKKYKDMPNFDKIMFTFVIKYDIIAASKRTAENTAAVL